MTKTKDNTETFKIPENISVFNDPKTHAKTIALPFQFPDGTNGLVMISRLTAATFIPSEMVESINIKFK